MSYFIRAGLFGAIGMAKFTQAAYKSASKNWDPKELEVDLTGKTFIITGGNQGIGRAVVEYFASKNGKVYMLCRNKERGEQAKNEIIKKFNNAKIIVEVVDISKQLDIRKFVDRFTSQETHLDVLVNNASILNPASIPRQLTEERIETHFATNTLGTFLLTNLLIPFMESTSDSNRPSRIVVVSSGGMYTERLNVSDLQFEKMVPFNSTPAYAQTKRQQIIFTERWAERERKRNRFVYFYVMHPGWALTPGVEKSQFNKLKSIMRTPEEGADTIIWLSVTTKVLNHTATGKFYLDRAEQNVHLPMTWHTVHTKAEEDKLIQECSKMTNFILPE